MTHPRQTPPQPHVRKRSPLPWIIFAVLLVAAGIVFVPKLLDSNGNKQTPVAAGEQDPFLAAIAKCDPVKRATKIVDRNRKLEVDGAGTDSPDGLNKADLTCILESLQVPGALISRMNATVAADGQLQGEWPGFAVAWTHDEKGLDLVVTRD
ncbi:hypothetical protein ACFQFC_16890 [Amorphoplanes digitatis]|uniref:Uncharacterized protein n=1 Tax=Actinoplanes digitatis TaxID=1868 RepID=A0A7W7MTL0_9ACTN|nr:hypothetical protein [Actinoplanes digitatis]MBB4765890.1 hypothetical protein [Actinoplanes digitatis]BFE75830.1 hypothetical protein GCM10020092_091310 [Actinoplanes digitatis]GID93318.1 hypothetical protein Adi01nite_27300 [Actinoplanes digitatis]